MALASALLLATVVVSPATAAGGSAPGAHAVTRHLPAVSGTSALSGHRPIAGASRTVVIPPRGTPWAPPRRVPRTSPAKATSQPAGPKAPSGAASIATTTTLVADPNPLSYPQQVHLTATVSPAPQPTGGFTPAVGFYVDGTFRLPAPLDANGVGTVDLSLAPGTYTLTAQFGPFDIWDASTSNPITEVVVQVPPLAAGAGPAAVQASAGYPGASASSQVQAADPSLAVGPGHVVQFSELGARFFDRSGSPLFHLSLPDYFFLEPNGQDPSPHQPRLVFDALHGRWLATEVTHDFVAGNGHIYLAISDTSDPTGSYWEYRFDLGNEAPSSPAIGLTSDKIAIGFDSNVLSTGSTKGSSVLVVNYADAIAHLASISYQRSVPQATLAGWRPAVNRSVGATLQAVGSDGSSSPAHILHLIVTGTITGPGTGLTFTATDLTGSPMALPGLGSEAAATGPTDAFWSNGSLWFVSTRFCLPAGDTFAEACVRVTEISTTGADALVQDFVVGANGESNFGGGIGMAGDGTLMIAYSQSPSGPSAGPVPFSTLVAAQLAGDPPNSVRAPQLVDQGSPWCPGGPACVGSGGGSATYLAVAPDPADAHAVFEGAVSSVTGGWRTWIARLQPATAAPSGTITLAGGLAATQSLRIGVGLAPAAAATATRVLVSNAPDTAGGRLAAATEAPIGWRMAWSLADTNTGGSSATGARSVYVQWGDGTGNWSSVQSATIQVDTPLGADFVPIAPARILDTRVGNGLSGPFVSGKARTFVVRGRGGVPPDAVAVTGNLTVTAQTSAGYVALGPVPTNTPSTSTLNFPKGDNRANGVSVALSSTGTLSATFIGTSSATTALIFDVTGYLLADDPNAPRGATWVPMAPVRALDTRVPIGLAGRFTSRVPRTFCITGCIPVPDDAVAVTGNLTVTGQTTAGYLFVGPTATSSPTSSTLNFPVGDNRANNVTVRLDPNGNLSAVFVGATSSASTNVIFDVTGYFVAGPWGGTYVPLNPTRLLDTRTGNGLTGAFTTRVARTFQVTGRTVNAVTVADGAVGVTGNLTVTRQTSAGYLFMGPVATDSPTSSTLNFPLGDTRANGVTVALAPDGTLSVTYVTGAARQTAQVIFDVTGYFGG